MQHSILYDLADDLLKRCPLCGRDRIATEGDYDCQDCFERQVGEHKALMQLDKDSSSKLDEKILPFGFDWEGM